MHTHSHKSRIGDCQRTKKVNIDWMVRADAPSIVEITIESRPTVAFVAKAVVANAGWVCGTPKFKIWIRFYGRWLGS